MNQREVGVDTESFHAGLRHVFRESPDVIIIGEMRDPESFAISLQAAETGHLVVSTLHSSSSTSTVDRIIDIFPPYQQPQIRVQLAENGLEGLKALEFFHPDLIISDIMMPEMDGFEFLERVRRQPQWATVPFIFLTAKGQRLDIRAGKQLGADDYLVKSVDPEDLLVAVRAKLDRALTIQQQSRREMDDLKRNLLNMLSHEFRTPLTYITGYVDLIQDGDWP